MTPLAVDAFCGAGGASEGIAAAGYHVIGADGWLTACRTHQAAGHADVLLELANPTPKDPR